MCPDQAVRTALERYADGVPHEELAREFLEYRRWTGDDPLLLVAEAAAASTGQGFVDGIKPTVERFRDAFVATGRVDSFSTLAELDREDEALVAALGAQRKREVLLKMARVLADRPKDGDFAALVGWAAAADHYRYDEDPVGSISGVGLATFQYLRQLAGVDTPRPDPTVERLLSAVDDDLEASPIDTSTNRRTIASCEWLAFVADYRSLELDRIAWWTATESAGRETALEVARD
ncbi:hypothetical protein HYG81_12940 [Natrinema zhouii]|uniref:Uncharacterized protein n=1 Tax=Natrinema zhouii TaxID=1710539 RepID=A0A7D6H1H6_9EURY|nr:hypothetical protein [Natrinema zhouii]QLK25007.1 hypothetical protein HYG81_12940 [Natrinema zhouii]